MIDNENGLDPLAFNLASQRLNVAREAIFAGEWSEKQQEMLADFAEAAADLLEMVKEAYLNHMPPSQTADTPPPEPQMVALDWSNFDGPERNVEWKPDEQELIYTALNYRDDDYGDADEDVGQQLVERLLAAWKRAVEGSKP